MLNGARSQERSKWMSKWNVEVEEVESVFSPEVQDAYAYFLYHKQLGG